MIVLAADMTEGDDQLFGVENSTVRWLYELGPEGGEDRRKFNADFKTVFGGGDGAADEQWDFLHCKIAHILKQGWRFVDWSSPLRAQNRIKYDPDNWMTLDKKGQAIFIDPDAENPVVPADVVKVALLQKVLHKSPDFKKL